MASFIDITCSDICRDLDIFANANIRSIGRGRYSAVVDRRVGIYTEKEMIEMNDPYMQCIRHCYSSFKTIDKKIIDKK